MPETTAGQKLTEARLARRLTIDEAAHATKMRPEKIQALENDDYSRFGGNAYAKGFLLIYSRFLNVDVSPQLRALDTSDSRVNLAEYQYLSQALPQTAPAVRRPFRRENRPPSILPLVMVVALMVLGGGGFWLYTSAKRLGLNQPPSSSSTASAPATTATTTPAPAPAPAAAAVAATLPAPAAAPAPAATATVAAAVPATTAPAVQPLQPGIAPAPVTATPVPVESVPPQLAGMTVKRALPADAPDPAAAPAAAAPAATPAIAALVPPPLPSGVNELSVEPLKKTWVTIRRDSPDSPPVFEDFLYPGYRPLKLRGDKFFVEVRDQTAVQIRKNGNPIAYQAPGVFIQ